MISAVNNIEPGSGPRVRLLDPHTINQIAAGEVVDRPASVVKELVENAIDAGATRIVVELEDAGVTLIRISDNGCGMSAEDAQSTLQRHATSKIRSIEDLLDVTSPSACETLLANAADKNNAALLYSLVLEKELE